MGKQEGYSFNSIEVQAFAAQNSIGIPLEKLNSYLSTDPDLRSQFEQPGIPIDSIGGELREWIQAARVVNPSLRIAIKGDEETPYPVIKEVMDLLQDMNITRYSFITDLEREADV
jgi:biopolymer transport protein ExbD